MAEIFVLGGGTPTPTAERFGSAHVLKIGEETKFENLIINIDVRLRSGSDTQVGEGRSISDAGG